MLYLDLDGVLANFNKGASEAIHDLVSGKTTIEGSKSAPRKIRKYLSKYGSDYVHHTDETLKERTARDVMFLVISQAGFFANLDKLSISLINYVRNTDVPFQFLTGGVNQFSEQEKRTWCQEVLGMQERCNVVIAGNGGKSTAELKAEFCKSANDVLVDDNDRNVLAWRQAGGVAIHWKGPQSLQELQAVLDEQKRANVYPPF